MQQVLGCASCGRESLRHPEDPCPYCARHGESARFDVLVHQRVQGRLLFHPSSRAWGES